MGRNGLFWFCKISYFLLFLGGGGNRLRFYVVLNLAFLSNSDFLYAIKVCLANHI
jgi:hypothetical protein